MRRPPPAPMQKCCTSQIPTAPAEPGPTPTAPQPARGWGGGPRDAGGGESATCGGLAGAGWLGPGAAEERETRRPPGPLPARPGDPSRWPPPLPAGLAADPLQRRSRRVSALFANVSKRSPPQTLTFSMFSCYSYLTNCRDDSGAAPSLPAGREEQGRRGCSRAPRA